MLNALIFPFSLDHYYSSYEMYYAFIMGGRWSHQLDIEESPVASASASSREHKIIEIERHIVCVYQNQNASRRYPSAVALLVSTLPDSAVCAHIYIYLLDGRAGSSIKRLNMHTFAHICLCLDLRFVRYSVTNDGNKTRQNIVNPNKFPFISAGAGDQSLYSFVDRTAKNVK